MHNRFSKHVLAGAMLVCCGLGMTMAHADDTSGSYLFGDWGGKRSHLADEGITFDLGYGSELAHNYSGGTAELTRYTDQWKLGSTFDLQKLWGWSGAKFTVLVTDRNGRNLGADANIGNNQLLQEVYGRGQTWHLTMFALEQKFFDERLTLKVGRLPVGADVNSFSCDFQNLTFCGAQPGNIVGDYWANWPTSQWATVLRYATTENTWIQIAGYQMNPKYVDDRYAEEKGLLPNFPSGTTGALIPLEFGWSPRINGLPGSYRVGVWYNTSKGNDPFLDVNHQPIALTGDKPLQHDGRKGAWITFSQQITGTVGGEGATVFLNITSADHATSSTNNQIAVGGEYKGIFGRPDDFVGAAFGSSYASGYAAKNQRLINELTGSNAIVNHGYERVTELFYSWSPAPSVSFRPNVQYVQDPGGSNDRHNALVLGLKTSVTF